VRLVILSLLLQTLPSIPNNPDALLIEKGFDISPTNVYGYLIVGLLGFIGYLKIESILKSYTIRQKDKYIKELHQKLLEAEKQSVSPEEAIMFKDIISNLVRKEAQLP
jgi:hypothetical protein